MAPTIPTCEPVEITSGDTVSWDKYPPADYPIADGWTLTYRFAGASVESIMGSLVVAATTYWQVRIPAGTTAAWIAGPYRLAGYMTLGSERHEIYNGSLTLLPDLTTATAGLTHARTTLDIIEAAIEGRITSDIESYQIHGRAVNKIPMKDLARLRGIYSAIVWREENGNDSFPTHAVAFVNK